MVWNCYTHDGLVFYSREEFHKHLAMCPHEQCAAERRRNMLAGETYGPIFKQAFVDHVKRIGGASILGDPMPPNPNCGTIKT